MSLTALLPSLIASATSYVTFISMPFIHAEPLLPGATSLKVGAGELIGAVLLGIGAGFGGRVYAWCVGKAKRFSKTRSPLLRVVAGGVTLGLLALLSDQLFDAPLSLGPGVRAVAWTEGSSELGFIGNQTVLLILFLFFIRALATFTTIAAGGTGGLFIPLAVQGILLGHLVQKSLEEAGITIYSERIWPILGLAAFLAAGYRTPIAAVMFVAEATGGGSAAVVPALIAAAVSQLVAGNGSVSAGQKVERVGHLEHRMTLPLASALNTEVLTVPSGASIAEFVWIHAVGRREAIVPVVDGSTYIGLCTVDACAKVDRDTWDDVLVGEVVDRDTPVAQPSWTIRGAVAAMDQSGWELLPVIDANGGFIGLVQASEIVKLEQILDDTGGAPSPF
ncbi:MAG: chloride channel protein [Acidimicrobiales bacterium]